MPVLHTLPCFIAIEMSKKKKNYEYDDDIVVREFSIRANTLLLEIGEANHYYSVVYVIQLDLILAVSVEKQSNVCRKKRLFCSRCAE